MTDLRLYVASRDLFMYDGYPAAWGKIKHHVREESGHRCVRCAHPYRCGQQGNGEWSPCDLDCTHPGPLRVRHPDHPRSPDYWHRPGEHQAQHPRSWLNFGYRVEAAWRILTVHHLDGDKGNCRWWNLAALCQRCHLTIQGKVWLKRTWPHEHSDGATLSGYTDRPGAVALAQALLAAASPDTRVTLPGQNNSDDREPCPTCGLPPDLARVLRDPSIIVPQDAAVFEMLERWRNAPSNTASAD